VYVCVFRFFALALRFSYMLVGCMLCRCLYACAGMFVYVCVWLKLIRLINCLLAFKNLLITLNVMLKMLRLNVFISIYVFIISSKLLFSFCFVFNCLYRV